MNYRKFLYKVNNDLSLYVCECNFIYSRVINWCNLVIIIINIYFKYIWNY